MHNSSKSALGNVIELYRERGEVPDAHGQPVSPTASPSVSLGVIAGATSPHKVASAPKCSKQYTPSGQFDWEEKDRREHRDILLFAVSVVGVLAMAVFGSMVF